jgi:hypothetical protein
MLQRFPESPYELTNLGLRMDLPIIPYGSSNSGEVIVLLNTTSSGHPDTYTGIHLKWLPRYARIKGDAFQRFIYEKPLDIIVIKTDDGGLKIRESGQGEWTPGGTAVTMQDMYVAKGRLLL